MTDRLVAACGFCWTYDEHTAECVRHRAAEREVWRLRYLVVADGIGEAMQRPKHTEV